MTTQLTMYDATIPVFIRQLTALSACLDKAEAHCTAKKIDPATMASERLIADMFPLSRQVQIGCDFAKGAAARLAGIEVPGWEDNEKTLADLRARIAKTIDYIKAFGPEKINGSETRDVSLKIAGNPVTLKGQPYLLGFALPNFYFHLTSAYAILRANGVDLGKRDFIGSIPGA